jgi:endonuclease I
MDSAETFPSERSSLPPLLVSFLVIGGFVFSPANIMFCNVFVDTSSNGCLIGTCASDDYEGKCFEPVDLYKGDFARSYFYLSVAYMDEWTCCDGDATDKWHIKPWLEEELREWHDMDPVDESEISRNEDIYEEWQHNRNPFIDYPDLVYQIADF